MTTWTPLPDPFNNLWLSALVASIPVLFLFYSLAVAGIKGHIAVPAALAVTGGVAVLAFKMPVSLAVYSAVYGSLVGLFSIGWIVINALFLYQLTVKSGQFEIIKDSIASVTGDRRLQAILIAFSFGAFLEGAAGFGTPVAITAAMLAGLGFNPFYAAGICLIANTAPVAYAAIGIPIVTAGAVTGLDFYVIGRMVGRQIPLVSAFIPFWLVFVMSGWKGSREVIPAALVSGASFALAQWFTADFIGPMLPNIIASLGSMLCLIAFLRVWKPKNTWRFPGEAEEPGAPAAKRYGSGTVIKAWSPFIVLTIIIADWCTGGVKALLDRATINIPVAGLDGVIVSGGQAMAVVFKFNWLSAPGTSVLIAAIITAIILRISPWRFLEIFCENLKNLRFALAIIASVMGFAYIANYSGMTPALGRAFTVTGVLFPFMSAFLGWLGVFVTGSDTSSNALFCKMQQVTAESMNINPVLAVATNCSGGIGGKMISPQSIAVATAACGLAGKEGDLLRFTFKHSILLTVIIGAIALLQAYLFPWMIPPAVQAAPAGAGDVAAGGGFTVLAASGVLFIILGLFAALHGKDA